MDQQEHLKAVMLQVCKLTGIEYTNDFEAFYKQLYKAGFITDEENQRFEQIGLQL
jgi:hypothetical protein